MHVATEADAPFMREVMSQIIDRIRPDGDHPPFNPAAFLTPPNFAMIANGGFFGLVDHGLARLEIHTAFALGAGGNNAVRESRALLRYLFIETNTYEVVTRVPGNNGAAFHLATMMGFRTLFARKGVWQKHGVLYPMEYMQLTVDDWILTGACRNIGETFHAQAQRDLPYLPHHAADPAHDCYVGAALDMSMAGSVDKAILFYNRYARLAGYATVIEQSRNPLRLKAGNMLITVTGRKIEVSDA